MTETIESTENENEGPELAEALSPAQTEGAELTEALSSGTTEDAELTETLSPAPTEVEPGPAEPLEQLPASRRRSPPGYLLLWLLVLASLGLNGYLVWTLLQIQAQANSALGLIDSLQQEAGHVSETLQIFRTTPLSYTVNISETIPVSFTVPVSSVVDVPIHTFVPVSNTVSTALPFPFNKTFIRTPISMTIPVNFNVQVPVSITVPISNTVPVRFTVPILLDLSRPPLGDVLDEIERILKQLQGQPPQ